MLYEPTNIVPSTLTNTGTIDVNDVVSFSWQINGNSAMTGFKMEMFQNNSDSTPVGTALEVTGLTVYGKDRLGNIVQYTYTSPTNQTWAQVFSGMANGNKYKFKITQYYAGGSVEQTSFSAINAFAKPEVTNLAVADVFDNVLAQSIINATATYTQAQGNNIQSVRWQLYENGTLIDDTGSIQTADLGYEYGGATSGNSYNLVCSVISEAGQTAEDNLAFSVTYATDNYPNNFTAQCLCGADGNLLEWELLGSTSIIIEGVASPTSGYSIIDNQLTLVDGATVTWNTVQKGDSPAEPMTFSAPWTAVWKGKDENSDVGDITKDGTALNSFVYTATFSPDGTTLVLGGAFSGDASVFSVSGTDINYVGDITKNGTALNQHVRTATFSHDGSTLVLGGQFSGRASVFSVSGTDINYVGDITKNGTALNQHVYTATFSPDGTTLVLGGQFRGYASVFSLSHDENNNPVLTYISDIKKNGTALFDNVYTAAFSPDGTTLVLGGYFSGRASVFSLSHDENNNPVLTYISDIKKNGTALNQPVETATFSPDGSTLVLGGYFSGRASVFSVSGTDINYVGDITKNGTALNQHVRTATFSHDGSTLVLGGQFSGRASVFSVSGTDINYVGDITKNGTALNDDVETATFSPDGSTLVLGGQFSGYANVFNNNSANTLLTISSSLKLKSLAYDVIALYENNMVQATISLANTKYDNIVIFFSQGILRVYTFLNSVYQNTYSASVDYTQSAVTSAVLTGEQTCTYFALVDGDGSAFIDDLSNPDFQFSWVNPNYTLNMYANFINDLNAGTGGGKGFMIYRQEVEILDKSTNTDGEIEYTTNALTTQKELVRLASTVPTIKDYGLKSNVAYQYTFYAYDANNAFYGSKTAVVPARQFQRYSLLATKFSQEDGCYHVYKEFQFSCNIADPTVSNNNSPQFMQNFTPYPTRINSSANYASGTLQSLIGFVDKETYNYFDSTALMDELYSLSTADYTLFLKDMKGHIRMVATSAPIQQTTTLKTRQMQVTVSFPWTEIGNANEVSIIQLPTDEGWNNDVQILDVRLKVDIETGELIVTYPYPYYGTKFNYSKNSGTLNTTTPYGVTPASVTLDTTAGSATSGAVIASVDDKEST